MSAKLLDRIPRGRATAFAVGSGLGLAALLTANLLAGSGGFWFALIPASLALGGFAQAIRGNAA